MSGGVNVKSAHRGPSTSGIPLPRSLLPSSPKADPRRRASDLPRPSTQTPKHTPTHSPSLCTRKSSIPGPSSRDLLRDSALKNQLFQRTGALPVPQVSRSAYSSPLTQRRVPAPHFKDTLDLATPAHISSLFPHDGNRNRSTFANKNQAWGASNPPLPVHFRRGGNTNTETQAACAIPPGKDEEPQEHRPTLPAVLNNGNNRPTPNQSSYKLTIRGHSDSASQSDEEMGTPEDSSPASSPEPLPLPPITYSMPVMPKVAGDVHDCKKATETLNPRVNMATVAPFSYRYYIETIAVPLCVAIYWPNCNYHLVTFSHHFSLHRPYIPRGLVLTIQSNFSPLYIFQHTHTHTNTAGVFWGRADC